MLAHVENLREYSDKKFVYLTFEKNAGNVLKNSYGKSYDDEAFILSEAAKILRRDVLSNPSTDFNGCFLEDCLDKFVPQSIKSFIDQVLQGNIINDSHRSLEQATLTIGQLLIHNSVKRVRQNKEIIKHRRSTDRESPLGIYLGILIHAKTRKKAVVERFYNFGVSISYDRVMDLSTKMGNRVLKHFEKENLVFPPILRQKLFTSAALDNIDHDPSSTTAEDSFHGTGISLFQHHTSEQNLQSRIFKISCYDQTRNGRNQEISRIPECRTDPGDCFRPTVVCSSKTDTMELER